MTLGKRNTILMLLVVVIAVFPLIILKDAEFAGADGLAKEAIGTLAPEYTPWFEPIFEPASGEIESLLFCLQAAIGAGVVGFVLGRITAKPKKDDNIDKHR